MKTTVVVTAVLALLLAGCVAEWSRPNTTVSGYDADRTACGRSAWRQYPENWGTGAGQSYEAARTDKNEVPRIRAYEACMTARGYTLTGQRTAL